MKKKIGISILVLLLIAIVYGVFKVMPIIKLLKDVDISEFASPSISDVDSTEDDNNKDNSETNNEYVNDEKMAKDYEDKGIEDSNVGDNSQEKSLDNVESDAAKESNNSNKNEENTDKNIAISSDKIDNVEKKITLADKVKAVKLIVTNLTPSDIETLKKLASGGLTSEEKREAVKIAYSRYNEEELKIIKELYRKYVK